MENHAGHRLTYREAGVDVEAGYEAVRLMKQHVSRTFRPEVLTGIGGFGGLFSLESIKTMSHPVLVSGTDGVGTKLKISFLQHKYDTIGIDCVAMCVNDIICSGAKPLFFLDYIACGKNKPEKIAEIVKGVADGCEQSGCALIGGETAEMPGFYPEDEFDLAGFAVGVVDKEDIIDGKEIEVGDCLIGLASSGLHSNGYSLVRKVFTDVQMRDMPELLVPTALYVKPVETLRQAVKVKGLAHITGGGFIENLPRMLPKGLGVIIDGVWEIPDIFGALQTRGNIERQAMFNTFNMGIGMVAAISPKEQAAALEALRAAGQSAYVIGHVSAEEGAALC